jgi:hypothetical protein
MVAEAREVPESELAAFLDRNDNIARTLVAKPGGEWHPLPSRQGSAIARLPAGEPGFRLLRPGT